MDRFRSEVTPESLVVVDSKGQVVQGEGNVDTSAFEIHHAMHAINPESLGGNAT